MKVAEGAWCRVASSRLSVPLALTVKSVCGSDAAQSCDGWAAVWITRSSDRDCWAKTRWTRSANCGSASASSTQLPISANFAGRQLLRPHLGSIRWNLRCLSPSYLYELAVIRPVLVVGIEVLLLLCTSASPSPMGFSEPGMPQESIVFTLRSGGDPQPVARSIAADDRAVAVDAGPDDCGGNVPAKGRGPAYFRVLLRPTTGEEALSRARHDPRVAYASFESWAPTPCDPTVP